MPFTSLFTPIALSLPDNKILDGKAKHTNPFVDIGDSLVRVMEKQIILLYNNLPREIKVMKLA